MKYTSNIKLSLPDLNSKDNWGAAINYNFVLVDREMTKLYSELANTKNLIGAGVPYYTELKDQNIVYKFVQIIEEEGERQGYYKLIYSDTPNPTPSDPCKTYYTYEYGDLDHPSINSIPVGTGAYVLNDAEGGTQVNINEHTATFYRGDLLVFLQQVGSIHDVNYGRRIPQKYPDTGYFIQPTVSVQNRTVIVQYDRKTYPDFVQTPESRRYSVVPAFYCITQTIQADTDTYTHSCQLNRNGEQHYSIQAFAVFYDNDTNNMIYVDHQVAIDQLENTYSHDVTITITLAHIPENAYYVLYAGQSLTATAIALENVVN